MKTSQKSKKVIFLSLSILLVSFLVVNFKKESRAANTSSLFNLTRTDSVPTNPKVDIKVKKKYDKKGNIIGYDSTYSYIYVSPGGTKQDINLDSLMQKFKPMFFGQGGNLLQDPLEEFFNNDSLVNQNFFDNHFFENQFNQNMFDFRAMVQKMDSLRNEFYKNELPVYPNNSGSKNLKVPQQKKKQSKKKSNEEFY